jgi:Peptidase family M28
MGPAGPLAGLWSSGMLNGRLYRVAFVPFLIALAVAAFSLGSRPTPVTTTLAPDAFEGQRAYAELHSLLAHYPERRPGGAGDEGLARYVLATLRGLGGTAGGGFSVHVRHLDGQTIEGQRQLTTVIAERPGSSSAPAILIVAHRDAARNGSAGELSGTAALLELARVFAARETKRTIVLASTSGGSGGDAGAAALAESLEAAGLHGPYDAAIVLGDVAGRRLTRPLVVPYSDGLGSAPLALQRTIDYAITQESGWDPGAPSLLGQLAHLSFPAAVGEQGVLDAHGIPAVLVGASGEHGSPEEPVSAEHLEALGRSVLSAIDALDTAPDVSSSLQSGLVLHGKTMPGWALRLLLGMLLLPPLVAGADGLARLRRRRRPVGRWALWTLCCGLPFLCCAVFCWVLGRLGVIGATPSVPVAGGAISLDGGAIAALVAVGLTFVLSWLLWGSVVRRLGIRAPAWRPDPDVTGLPVQLILTGVAIVVWLGNPYAALLAIPALHLWLLLASPEMRPRRPFALAILLLSLAPLGLLLSFYARQLAYGPGELAWSAALVLAGGHVGLGSALLWSVAFGCGAGALLVALAGHEPPLESTTSSDDGFEITIRGPMSYAGPGSLGGTESALRR